MVGLSVMGHSLYEFVDHNKQNVDTAASGSDSAQYVL